MFKSNSDIEHKGRKLKHVYFDGHPCWEYKVVNVKHVLHENGESHLQYLGESGWELVSTQLVEDGNSEDGKAWICFFKRPMTCP